MLRYSDLSREAIAVYHKQNSGLRIELPPLCGRLFLYSLNQRDKVERNLLTSAAAPRFLWDFMVLRFYDLINHLFFRRLLILDQYVSAVNAAHGSEVTPEGNYVFLLVPVAEKSAVQSTYVATNDRGTHS